jgi:hypothetical protein
MAAISKEIQPDSYKAGIGSFWAYPPVQEAMEIPKGIAMGGKNIIRNLGNIAAQSGIPSIQQMGATIQPGGLVPTPTQIPPQRAVSEKMPTAGGELARIATEIGLSIPAGTAAVSGLSKVSPSIAGLLQKSNIARGTVEGAATGVLTGEGTPLQNLGYGAAGGAAGGLVGSALGGIEKSRDAERLLKEGFPITPGQAAGESLGARMVRRLEETSTSIPLAKEVIDHARAKSLITLRKKAVERALPKGMSLPRYAGNRPLDALDDVSEEYTKRYTTVLNSVPDAPVNISVPDLQNKIVSDAFPKQTGVPVSRDSLESAKAYIAQSVDIEQLTPKALFIAQSDLKREGLRIMASPTANLTERELANGYLKASESLMDVLESQSGIGTELKELGHGYRKFINLFKETSRTAANQAGLMPKQIAKAASKAGDKEFQRLAETASRVLPSSIPSSGTGERLLGAAGLYGGIAGLPGLLAALPGAAITQPPFRQGLLGQLPAQRAFAETLPTIGAYLGTR